VPAVQIDRSLSGPKDSASEMDVRQGAVRLLFVSPERLTGPEFCTLGARSASSVHRRRTASATGATIFARNTDSSAASRNCSPGPPFTRTRRSDRAERDIARSWPARSARAGRNFEPAQPDYRVLPRTDLEKQVREVIARHPARQQFIYCATPRRDDTNAMLQALCYKACHTMPA